MAAKKNPVMESLDLGFGYVKHTKTDEEGNVTYHSFPSLAVKSSGQDMSMGILSKRNTIKVLVEGLEYEVGPDSSDLDSNDSTRNLNEQYIHSDQYKALLYGSLYYMGHDVIDLLVVGLPVSGLNKTAELEKIIVGEHHITKDKKVEVKKVLVLPQPLGGLYYCISNPELDESFEDLIDEYNLVIDPGFLTFDFIVSNGDKLIESRSSAKPGGVSKILSAIATSITEKHNLAKRYENLSAIDKGLKKRRMKINGKKEDLNEHIKNTKDIIEGSVTYMKNIVGDGSDIDNIILIGGGSDIFKKTIESHFVNHKIISIEDPQMANVKGYYSAGLKVLSLQS